MLTARVSIGAKRSQKSQTKTKKQKKIGLFEKRLAEKEKEFWRFSRKRKEKEQEQP